MLYRSKDHPSGMASQCKPEIARRSTHLRAHISVSMALCEHMSLQAMFMEVLIDANCYDKGEAAVVLSSKWLSQNSITMEIILAL